MDSKPIAEARANLSELIVGVRLLRHGITLTSRGKPQAALVPFELAQAAETAGGMDAAVAILRKAAQLRAALSPASGPSVIAAVRA
jgi:prevent-host-death family protein